MRIFSGEFVTDAKRALDKRQIQQEAAPRSRVISLAIPMACIAHWPAPFAASLFC